MRKIFDSFSWLFLLAFFVPSTFIVASWNSLPDDSLYSVKLAMEKSLLVLVSPSYLAKGTLEMKYTERRFNETKRLLASKQSVEGLPYLNAQVASTKAVIEQAPDTKVQAQLAKNYIITLTSVSSQLEEQKRSLATSPVPSSASVTPTGKASVANLLPTTPKTPPPAAAAGSKPLAPTPPLPTAAATNAPPASATGPATPVAVTEITQTQEAIAVAISDLRQVAKEAEKEEKKEDRGNRREEAGNDHGFQEDRAGNDANRGRGETD